MSKRALHTVLFCLIFSISYGQFYQGSYQEFGKNRVQYNGFSWKYHNYQRFKIHYSGINEDIAVYVARTLHHYLGEAESKLDYVFPEKLDVIVYESQSKFRQSNLGVNNEDYSNVGGTTRIVGSKIFMYFEGDHESFNQNIKAAVYEVLLMHMLFGGDWKDQLKSTMNSGIPPWLEKGLISYFVKEWDDETESRVKDLILTKKIDRFNKLTEEEKAYAGHAVWNYIAETHGSSIIPNIIYITRVTKNIERGFYSLLNMDFVKLNKNYIAFYRSRYVEEYKNQTEPEGDKQNYKIKKESVYYDVKISPDGSKIAYVENTLGRYRVKVLDTLTGKTQKIFAAEPKMERIQDHSYPVIGWHPSGEALTFFAESKGALHMYIYTFEDKSLVEKEIKELDKILDFAYSKDGKKMVFSGVIRGQSDLYLMDMSSQVRKQLTNDIYDDLNPQFIDNSSRVIFSSNRTSDTIFKQPDIDFIDTRNDIFIYNLRDADHTYKMLEQVTQTPDFDETQPYAIGPQKYIFLSDQNGISNRFIAERDSVISHIDTTIHYRHKTVISPQTNYVTSILEQNINQNNQLVYLIYQNSQYKFITDAANTTKIDVLWNTTYVEKRLKRRERQEQKNTIQNNPDDTIQVGDMNYQRVIVEIGSTGEQISNPNISKTTDSTLLVISKFSPPKYSIYQVNFAKDFVLSQFDNNFLFPNYQPYAGPGSVYFNPGMNALFKIGASDLFDDYKLLGGVRIPTSFTSGGEFLFMAQHLRERLDHRLVVYRQKTINASGFYKSLTHDVRYRISYPFSEIFCVRATVNLRKDRQIFIPYSDNSLLLESRNKYNSGLNLELVFDNTIPIELNIMRGTRFKLFAEYLQELGGNYDPTFNLGLDFRNYTRIARNFIWVNRLAGATSLGDRKLLYYMGGVDNWILRPNPDFDQSITVDPSQNFGFQTIATPVRGFIQNVRNGNSFVVYNTELRLPVFTFFSSYPIKSDLMRHFQVVAFGDVGTAWTGPNPFSSENYFNTQMIHDKPVTINVENLREPIIGGFGFGFRSRIWGYFVRLDFAWGIEDLEIQKPITYFSLSKDI
ncbi:MAG: PD40 domain-containing protein [Bacteroidetes bacterium]|nr:PD40 domain-containing protein [Bacteroidota bacterium]